jgi:hypothetical protein
VIETRRIFAIACVALGLAACLLAPASSASAAPDTIFGTATPATIDSGDGHSVELGVKFTSEVAGSVTGIRFYKAATNTGTHIASLWSAGGALLASATFTSETASGWQQVNFSTPVAIAANTTYIAAYLAPNGHYSDTSSAFASGGVSKPPLNALANSVSANGVYAYSTTSAFPTSTYKATNYWVDVDFEPGAKTESGGSAPVTDANVTVNGHGTVTTPGFNTVEAGEQLLAFVASDGPSGADKQSATVSGAGLTWSLAKRSNSHSGDAEIWSATAPATLTDATVTATPAAAGYDQSLTVISLEQSAGVGASVAGGAANGAPSVSLTTSEAGSLVYAVGNDWDSATARTVGPNQTLLDQDLDTKAGNTFWSQYTSQPIAAAGSAVTINDTAPTGDEWNMAAVEVLAAHKATTTTPGQVTNVSASAGDGSASLTWSAPASGGSPITSYTITPYIDGAPQTASTVTGSPPATGTTIGGLTNGTAYTFTVTATNALGSGPPSAASNAVTPGGEAIAYPDLQVLMPTGDIAIVQDGSARTLEFTHISEDAGAGPWELRPVYNAQTGISQGYQALYTMPSPGVWKYAYSVPFAGPMIWTPPSDYNFPLDKFWLYSTAAGGGLGSVVATSPKVLYCMTSDTYVGGVPNTPTDNEYPGSACEKPEGKLGLSVGWGDQYEATDGGEGIPITSLPNGTYWLRGEIDPNDDFEESNTANNITDTKLEITGDTVKVLEQTHPNSTPPTVAVTSPSADAALSGTTTLSASASGPAPIASVQFLLDGEPIGSPVTAPPYTIDWTAANVTPGTHYLSAQATDSNGFVGTAPEVPVTVSGKVGSVTIDDVVSQTGTTTATTPAFSTTEPGEVLLAFADSDGPAAGSQTLNVSGAGLTWSLVKRSNTEAGDSEIWTATTVASLLNATVTATAADSGYKQSLSVAALSGAGGVGAAAAAAAAKGAPSIGLTATEAGSVAFATGEDPAAGVARTLGSGQELLTQTVETSAGDAFWTQYTTAPSSAAGQTLTLDDTAPTAEPWDMAAVEVLPSPPEQSGTEAPRVSIVNPTAGEIVSNTTQVTANVSDNAPISSVQFYLDGKPLGAPVTKSPYAISWDTTEASNAAHSLTATATNTSAMTGTSAPVSVTVQNPPEEETCFVMDLTVNATGKGAVTTQTFTNAEAGEQMYAFVSSDGPPGAGKQSVTVSGAGLTWTLVKRANTQSGDAEIWTAEAKNELSNATVTSTPAVAGYDQSLTVISMQGSNGSGASVAGGAASGEASVSLTTEQTGSLVYAVGSDWSNATSRTLGPNQTLMRQDLDTVGGNTFWSQFTSAITGPAGSVVTMNDPAPTNDVWNMAAVEIVSDVGG